MGIEGAIDPSKSMLSIYNSASENSEKESDVKAKNDLLKYDSNCDTDSPLSQTTTTDPKM